MYFLNRPDTNTYITIHKEDEQNFLDIITDGQTFKKENKFRLIKDKDEIKHILETRYASNNRGEEYTAGLPSATLISSALFPYDLNPRSSHNQIMLLRWNNDIEVSDMSNQLITNKLSTDSGTFIHEILELALRDRNTRIFDKSRNLKKYIEEVCNDPNIINMIDNFADRKQYFVDMATATLSKFFQEEIPLIDPVFDEIFIKNKGIQGAIDLVNYKNKDLYISDFKTSKKSMSYNQVAPKGYLRQLYIYSRMLLHAKMISPLEYKNLKFQIYFFNWNSHKSACYEYTKSEIDKSKGYCEFILNWYFKMRDMDIDVHDVI